MAEDSKRLVSVIVPVFNEEGNLEPLHRELETVLEKLDAEWEVLFVDDGSTDGSAKVIEDLHEADPDHVAGIVFRRNFGQTAALSAGFRHARGDVIIPIDADLQNDPHDIPRLLRVIDQGYDVASGWRFKRRDAYLTRTLPSVLANRLIAAITGVQIHDFGCTLKAYRREVVKDLNIYGEMHRFLPALASWGGATVAEIKVRHRPRRHGKSNYGFGRTTRVLLDLVTVKFLLSYSTKPMQIFGMLGLLSFLGGSLCGAITVYQKLFPPYLNINRNGWLFLSIFFLLSSFQFLSIGLLGEIMIRSYYEGQEKRPYVIRKSFEKNRKQ